MENVTILRDENGKEIGYATDLRLAKNGFVAETIVFGECK